MHQEPTQLGFRPRLQGWKAYRVRDQQLAWMANASYLALVKRSTIRNTYHEVMARFPCFLEQVEVRQDGVIWTDAKDQASGEVPDHRKMNVFDRCPCQDSQTTYQPTCL